MIPNEEEKNALQDFNDIEPRELRDYNRGAVLANIHETYIVEGKITGRAIKGWLRELTDYLARLPHEEIQSAKEAMKLHLNKRGSVYAPA